MWNRPAAPEKSAGVVEFLKHFDADFVALDINDPLRRDIVKRIAIMLQRTFALYGDERVIVNVMRAVEETGDIHERSPSRRLAG